MFAAENLKKSMTFTMSKIESRKIPYEKKLRWLKALTRQAEALVDVMEALNKIGSKSAENIDLAKFLGDIQEKLPTALSTRRGPEPRRTAKALNEFNEATSSMTINAEEIPYGRGFRTTRRN